MPKMYKYQLILYKITYMCHVSQKDDDQVKFSVNFLEFQKIIHRKFIRKIHLRFYGIQNTDKEIFLTLENEIVKYST